MLDFLLTKNLHFQELKIAICNLILNLFNNLLSFQNVSLIGQVIGQIKGVRSYIDYTILALTQSFVSKFRRSYVWNIRRLLYIDCTGQIQGTMLIFEIWCFWRHSRVRGLKLQLTIFLENVFSKYKILNPPSPLIYAIYWAESKFSKPISASRNLAGVCQP